MLNFLCLFFTCVFIYYIYRMIKPHSIIAHIELHIMLYKLNKGEINLWDVPDYIKKEIMRG